MAHSSWLFWGGVGGEDEGKVWGLGEKERASGVFESVWLERRREVVRKIEGFILRVEKEGVKCGRRERGQGDLVNNRRRKVRARVKSHECTDKVEKSWELESQGPFEGTEKGKKEPRKWKKDREAGRAKERDPKGYEFLVRMEKRMEERGIRRKAMEERRRRREIETEKELERKEKEKQVERRKSLKEEKEKIERRREKALGRVKLAEEHRVRCLLLKGLRGWRRVLAVRERQAVAADRFNERRLSKMFFGRWKEETDKRKKWKEERAKLFHENHLKRQVFGSWMATCLERKSQVQAASDWHDLKTVEKYFRLWMAFSLEEHLKYLTLKQVADSAFEKKLKAKLLKMLRKYPKMKRIEINGVVRRAQWQRKIQEIIPDYQPICSASEFG